MKVDGNDRCVYDDLTAAQKTALVSWIKEVLVPAPCVFSRNSYAMKHDFERDQGGFYTTNGQYKRAMQVAGFEPVDPNELNWRFRVKPARELDDREKRKLGYIGRGWPVRERVPEEGFLVVRSTDWARIDRYIHLCAKLKHPVIRVERRGHLARVVIDMITADWKLSETSIDEITALFTEIDPRCRNWSYIDACYNYISKVPVYKAVELATKLVNIALMDKVDRLEGECSKNTLSY